MAFNANRPMLRRVVQIDREIRSGGFPNAQDLAQDIEVTMRCIYRDIEYMRSSLSAPIEYSRKKRGYYYTEESFTLPTVQLTQGDLISIFIAEKALRQYRGTPYEHSLNEAFRKLMSLLPDPITIDLSGLDHALSFQTTATTVQDIETFCVLANAVINQRQLRMAYHTQYRDTDTDRVVDPYHLTNIDGDWYLIAFCHKRNEIRMFSPSRVRQVEETGADFERPKDFTLSDYLGTTFRVMKGTGDYQVVLRFDADQSRYIRERIWHSSQKLETFPDGSVQLTMELSNLEEIERWILSYGAHCQVLEPQELRATILQSATEIAAFYQSPLGDETAPGSDSGKKSTKKMTTS